MRRVERERRNNLIANKAGELAGVLGSPSRDFMGVHDRFEDGDLIIELYRDMNTNTVNEVVIYNGEHIDSNAVFRATREDILNGEAFYRRRGGWQKKLRDIYHSRIFGLPDSLFGTFDDSEVEKISKKIRRDMKQTSYEGGWK